MTVRTRIAPSPTGDPHVGTAYIALFNLCFARQHAGQFILRVEDTDRKRSSAASEQHIMQALKWLGIEWDEGPDLGGPYGPYRQSERGDLYRQVIEQLIAAEHAFYCFCTPQRLETLRAQQIAKQHKPGYDGCCLGLDAEQIQDKLARNEPHVIRMKIPSSGHCEINDLLRGKVVIDWQQIDMQILLKADGMPTYHLASVVDDHHMKISHVIRGEEWINSTPKHLLLYQYLNWPKPQFCHMPLLRNPDKTKLSKRKNPTSITYYERMGFAAPAVLNYLGRMGWSMPDGREKFCLHEMIDHFDLQRISLGGPIFDVEKLSWLSGCWMREQSVDHVLMDLKNWAQRRDTLRQVAPLVQSRMEKYSDFAAIAGFMFCGDLPLKAEDFTHKQLDKEQICHLLQFALWRLERLECWEKTEIFTALQELATQMQLKLGDFMRPLFISIAGTDSTFSIVDAMQILGPDMTRARLKSALHLLGGLSKKTLKKAQKTYANFTSTGLSP